MKAETAYNVIQALPESEVKRLHTMLGLQPKERIQKKPKNPPLVSKTEVREYLLKKLSK